MTEPLATTASPFAGLALIAPGMGTALRQSGAGPIPGLDGLSLLAGRGSIRRASSRHSLTDAQLRTWQRGLLEILRLDPRDYPSAPVSALGELSDDVGARENYWLHADLVHLAAGLDRLTFLPLTGPAAVTAAERQALAPVIAQHLQDSSLQLLSDASGHAGEQWLLRSQRPLDLQTASPEAAAANELDAVMPSGPDAREVRRIMTECQMLLHDHEVNERRQRRGLPPINALWPWGGGTLSQASKRALPEIFSDHAFVRGVCRMHSREAAPMPSRAAMLLEQVTGKFPVVAVIEADTPAALERDWIQPLVAALRTGRIPRFDLILDEWHIHATRGMLRRFWRKPLSPPAWPT